MRTRLLEILLKRHVIHGPVAIPYKIDGLLMHPDLTFEVGSIKSGLSGNGAPSQTCCSAPHNLDLEVFVSRSWQDLVFCTGTEGATKAVSLTSNGQTPGRRIVPERIAPASKAFIELC